MAEKNKQQKASVSKMGFSFAKFLKNKRTLEQLKYLEASRQDQKELTYFI